MSSKQEGGRKISGEEKNLANKQAELFGLQTDQMKQLQQVLTQLQPQQYQMLGFDPSTGMPLQRGQLPTAPTAVSAPQGARPETQRELFASGRGGRKWGKNDEANQARSLQAQQAWDQQNAAYQQYQQQLQAYNQFAQQAQTNPEQVYLPDVAGKRQQESNLLDQLLAGNMTPEQAMVQGGALGGVASGRAGFMGEFLRWLNDNPNAQAAQGALSGYQNELTTGGAEAPALQQLLGQYQNQLAGNIPEASQMSDFLAAITRGVNGREAVNPMVERQLDDAMQERRTRLFQQLGAGYETSSAGIEALSNMNRTRAGTIDELNQADLMNAVSGYASLLGGSQNRQAQTANQYMGLSGNQQSRQAQLLNQYLGLNEDTRLNVAGNLAGYTGLTNFSEAQRMQEYQNELGRRTGLMGLQNSIATAPYSGVDYTSLINSYTGALGAATQRQTGPVQQGGGLGGALGGLAGTALGGGLGYLAGGPVGAQIGMQMGGSLGGAAAGGGGYQPPPLYNLGGMGGGQQQMGLGSFYTKPYFG